MPAVKNGTSIVALGAMLCAAQPAPGQVTVRFSPPDKTVLLGETFTLDIFADITNPIVGWGLDTTIDDGSITSLAGDPLIGPAWLSAFAPDGDNLAALAFPNSVSGIDVLLATLTFSADAVGQTDLFTSATAGDLTEGFALDPTGFASVTFAPGHVTVIPEPAVLALLGLGGLAVASRPIKRARHRG